MSKSNFDNLKKVKIAYILNLSSLFMIYCKENLIRRGEHHVE